MSRLAGRTYQVVVKTVSGSVASWPATGNVTTRPLPVHNIREETRGGGAGGAGAISLAWEPNADSQQDSYKVMTSVTTDHATRTYLINALNAWEETVARILWNEMIAVLFVLRRFEIDRRSTLNIHCVLCFGADICIWAKTFKICVSSLTECR